MRWNRPLVTIAALTGLAFALAAPGAESPAAPAEKPAPKPAAKAAAKDSNPVVVIKTSLGEIQVKLFQDKAPATVENFLKYVDSKFYDGTIFHRTIDGFMIQGGGFDTKRQHKAGLEPIKNEAGNGLSNLRGTLAMARTSVVDSATSQFFINVKDNPQLNHRDETPQGFGYCVFGEVAKGMDVVDKIKAVKVKPRGPDTLSEAEPEEPVVIESVRRAK